MPTSLTVLNLLGPFSFHFDSLEALNFTDINLREWSTPGDCLTLLRICSALVGFSAEINTQSSIFKCGTRFPTTSTTDSLVSFRLRNTGISPSVQYLLQPLHLLGLKQASIDIEWAKLGDIIRCLESSPDLEHLTLRRCMESQGVIVLDIVLRLTLRSEEQLCPNLKSIALYNFDLEGCDEEVTCMVMSRWYPENSTRTLESATSDDCRLVDVLGLTYCCDEGLSLHIHNIDDD
ncbi:hypothetical protein EW145_g3702 [Phellinidium pouzarii]|uniref:F-box domain-containing protein n=1 Tax=Phellinidium pouzarii TaxID=167371 RepID=A0A4S4L672_9AGAM|nr:hypothetical protein EW145_g3702 [Phellinidium pouzarii]